MILPGIGNFNPPIFVSVFSGTKNENLVAFRSKYELCHICYLDHLTKGKNRGNGPKRVFGRESVCIFFFFSVESVCMSIFLDVFVKMAPSLTYKPLHCSFMDSMSLH